MARRPDSLANLALLLAVLAAYPAAATGQGPGALQTVVGRAANFAVSPPLRSLPPPVVGPQPAGSTRFRTLAVRYLHPEAQVKSGLREVDPVVQGALLAPHLAAPAIPAPASTFDGISDANNVSRLGFAVFPPDTNGDVGRNHYVQFVNLLLQIFDKNTGTALLPAALKLSSLFAGLGGPCAAMDDGDTIALYDALADRWLLSELSEAGPPFHECVALSQTGDPTGAYFVYDFVMPKNHFNDYPKFGVWPDAYYMTDNQFTSLTGPMVGAGAFAFNRAKLLAGDPSAEFIYFDLELFDPTIAGVLPADFDGPPPPLGSPGYFAYFTATEFGDPKDALRLFEFHADFSNPSNSRFVERPESPIATASFDPTFNCGSSGLSCIPQPPPASASANLDVLSDRLMYRLQYRNFGAYESLVTNHTVDVNGAGHAGVRYYELRRTLPAGSFFINEQASFAPDANHRWMGSAAMDRQGNLAVGYSVSSSTTFPSIRYAGRSAADPSGGLFQGEATLQAGSGSQTSSGDRWGDYSMLAVDPVDDCTFWYTNEYYATSSPRGWRTRIGTFRFPACTPETINTSSPTSTPTPTLTPSATATSTPTPTPYGITGRVLYYGTSMPVSGVTVVLQGPTPASTQTDATGAFVFTGVGSATVTLQPQKVDDVRNSVGAVDAVDILQAVVGLRNLSPIQSLACDANGDGVITALDAVRVLQLHVGLISQLPVVSSCQTDWVFVPAATPVPRQTPMAPHIANPTCQPGSITYQPLTGQADNQNFLAVLFGDCSGNWPGQP